MRKYYSLLLFSACTFILLAFTGNPRDLNNEKKDSFAVYVSPDDPKPGTSVLFTVTCFEHGTTFTWDFGDGSDKSETFTPGANHTFSKAGIYNVKVRSNDGRFATNIVMVAN